MSTKYLNADNILKKVYDPSTEGLRTTAVASFVGGTVEIAISDLTDSIKIGDGSGKYLDINDDGSINVNIVDSETPYTKFLNIYGEENVAPGIETILITFTASAGKTYKLIRVQFSGEQIAKYIVYINSVAIATSRTHHASGLSGNIEFVGGTQEGLEVLSGDIIELKVLHNRPGLGDFEGRIQIHEVDNI